LRPPRVRRSAILRLTVPADPSPMNRSSEESAMKVSPTVAGSVPRADRKASPPAPAPTVSVIIPNYNRGALVAETIANMLGQSLPPFEVIVIDDGSTDDSRDIIKGFGEKVRLLCQENLGPGAARNAGLLSANGEFIQFMDSDDLASLNKLEAQACVMREQNADISYGPWIKLSFDGQRVIPENHVLQSRPVPADKNLLHWFLTNWSIVFQTCLFRRTFLLEAGLYRTDMFLAEDLEYFTRLLLKHPKIVFTPDSLTLYRLHAINKLTESGTQDHQKTLDRARYLAMARFHCRQATAAKDPTRSWHFRIKAWRCLQELNGSCDAIPDLRDELLASLPPRVPQTAYRLGELMIQISGGLRQRLCGSRWARPYQAAKLTDYQIRLIEELGFTLS
jgi:glycosyltransferase involved in cell wall biosynthesis